MYIHREDTQSSYSPIFYAFKDRIIIYFVSEAINALFFRTISYKQTNFIENESMQTYLWNYT